MENVTKNAIVDSDDGHVEVESVIGEEERAMALIIEASDETAARTQFHQLVAEAQTQSAGTTGEAQWEAGTGQLKVTLLFPSAAERLTFEMSLS
ncbi:DUF406 family protein [Ferrimonas balearica]|uniref:DUF406 family protein n=1 Tax=Ferrimonas balearica TaxID=44012 RepID=UPI001C99AB9A|nr:DUF406 family protein [Ferrimonas balearica]MBY5991444.1 DUF406 family protein [Ferrimonas balearica]